MPKPTFEALKPEYERLFNSCGILPDKVAIVTKVAAQVAKGKDRYQNISNVIGGTGIPWWFIGMIHNLECSLDFSKHLHNGDSLTRRTIRVPANRPVGGNPPFTFEFSATDALKGKSYERWPDWSIPGALFKLEEYNGWGYRLYHPDVLTPYLWSFTDHYTKGKYTQDGKFDPNAVSKQVGCAAILKGIQELGLL